MAKIKQKQDDKSVWQTRRDAINVCKYMRNNCADIRAYLRKLDDPTERAKLTSPKDIKKQSLVGDFYGYPQFDRINPRSGELKRCPTPPSTFMRPEES